MRRLDLSFLAAAALVAALSLEFSPRLSAQDSPKKTEKKADKTDSASKDPQAEWVELVGRRKKLVKELDKLQADFQKADDDGKKAIIQNFQKMAAEFQRDVQPRIIKLAPQIYEKDPTDLDAAEVMVGKAFQENKYEAVIAMVQKVIDAGKTSAPLLTLEGVSQFATHDFEKAQKTLGAAEKADKDIFPQLGAPFLAAAGQYVDFWKKEQEIREKEEKDDDLPQVLFKTTKGEIVLELFENEAPNTVANFISLVEAKKYDGIVFHRVIPTFMAQGGDPNTLDDDPDNDGQGGPGYTIACECYAENARKHFQGTLSMAHAGKDTGGSQFFITHLPTPHLNANVKRQSGHTVFGRVIKGMDVALSLQAPERNPMTGEVLKKGDKIISAKVLRKRDHAYVPKKLGERPAGKKPAKKSVDE